MKSKILILLFALVSIFVVFNEDKPHHNQFSSDVCGYYLYLPAIIIYHDLDKLSFYHSVDSTYNYSLSAQYSLYNINGNKLDKYPVGVSIFELPLFLMAHLYCNVSHQYPADGFAMPYQLACIFSNILWVILGLIVLRRFLKEYFNDNIVSITLLAIAFGTNLYAYTSFEVGMSHSYSFFLFSVLLYLTDSCYKKIAEGYSNQRLSMLNVYSILIGLTMGFIFIVRPVNIIVAVIPLFWGVADKAFKERIILSKKYYANMLLASGVFFTIAIVQFMYWKYITGHWLFYSYMEEGFNFLHPNIWNGLFSYRKGWFIYTPMAIIGLWGIYYLARKDKNKALLIAAYFLLMIYTVFSWREWWYGGGFGCRPMIETFAILSLPLGAIMERFYSGNLFKKMAFFALVFFFTALNIFQTFQYSAGYINWSRMTKQAYWYVFGKFNVDHEKLEKYLIKKEDEEGFEN